MMMCERERVGRCPWGLSTRLVLVEVTGLVVVVVVLLLPLEGVVLLLLEGMSMGTIGEPGVGWSSRAGWERDEDVHGDELLLEDRGGAAEHWKFCCL